jgi:hypothetical protein
LTGIFGRHFLKEFMDDLVPDGYELYNFWNTNAYSGHGVASAISRGLYVKNLYENGSFSSLDEDIVIRWQNGLDFPTSLLELQKHIGNKNKLRFVSTQIQSEANTRQVCTPALAYPPNIQDDEYGN